MNDDKLIITIPSLVSQSSSHHANVDDCIQSLSVLSPPNVSKIQTVEQQHNYSTSTSNLQLFNDLLSNSSSSTLSGYSIGESIDLHNPYTSSTSSILSASSIMNILHHYQLFSNCSQTFLQEVISKMTMVTCIPGELIYLEGDQVMSNNLRYDESILSNEGSGAIVSISSQLNESSFTNVRNEFHSKAIHSTISNTKSQYVLYIILQGICEIHTRSHLSSIKADREIIFKDKVNISTSNNNENNVSASVPRKKRTNISFLQVGDVFGELVPHSIYIHKETIRTGSTGAKLLVLSAHDYHSIVLSLPQETISNTNNNPVYNQSPIIPSIIPQDHPLNKSSNNSLLSTISIPQLSELQHIHTIGMGSFGIVKLVRSTVTNALYALKCIPQHTTSEQTSNPHPSSSSSMEKWVLQHIQHPFLVSLITNYEDTQYNYLLTEYIAGGELFSLLAPPEEGGIGPILSIVHGRFIIASLVDALLYLHQSTLGILIYRDLKPENILFDKEGYIKLCDFGCTTSLLSRKDQRAMTLCGTPEYLAPEIIYTHLSESNGKDNSNKFRGTLGYTEMVDWWSLGILTYELFIGYTPFVMDDNNDHTISNESDNNNNNNSSNINTTKELSILSNPIIIFRRILKGKLNFPDTLMDYHVRDFIRQLLNPDPTRRLGSLSNDIRNHPWFTSSILPIKNKHLTVPGDTSLVQIDPLLYEPINWTILRNKQYQAPWKPNIISPEDTHYFQQDSDADDENKEI